MLLVGINVVSEDAALMVRLATGVSISPIVKLSAAVLVSSLIVWLAIPVIGGGSFTALTVTVKTVVVIPSSPLSAIPSSPASRTVTVIVLVPLWSVTGVNRKLPVEFGLVY